MVVRLVPVRQSNKDRLPAPVMWYNFVNWFAILVKRLINFMYKYLKMKFFDLNSWQYCILLLHISMVPNRREVLLTTVSCIFPVVQCSLSNLFVYICVRFNHSLSWTVSVKPLIQYLKIEWCSFTEKKWQWAPSIVYAEH